MLKFSSLNKPYTATGFIFGLIVILAGAFVLLQAGQAGNEPVSETHENALSIPAPVRDILTVEMSEGLKHSFEVEIADTPSEREKGLMFRTEMEDDHGMLFVFEDEKPRAFWMKNTLIPLDMIFIDEEGRIVHIHEKAVPEDLTPVPSRYPAQYVLELNGGRSAELGLAIGDQFKPLRNYFQPSLAE